MILKRNRVGREERVKNEASFFIRSFCVCKIMTGKPECHKHRQSALFVNCV